MDRTKGMRVFSLAPFQARPGIADVFTKEPIPFEELYAHRVRVPVEGISINIASREDLKVLKQAAGRPQDLQDIAALDKLNSKP